MPHPVAAPSEADALRRLAEAMKRVHLPAPLFHLLLACNLLGDALRDILDPRLRGVVR